MHFFLFFLNIILILSTTRRSRPSITINQLVISQLNLIAVGNSVATCIPLRNTPFCVCVWKNVCVKQTTQWPSGPGLRCVCVWKSVTKALLIFDGGLIHPVTLWARWCVTAFHRSPLLRPCTSSSILSVGCDHIKEKQWGLQVFVP